LGEMCQIEHPIWKGVNSRDGYLTFTEKIMKPTLRPREEKTFFGTKLVVKFPKDVFAFAKHTN